MTGRKLAPKPEPEPAPTEPEPGTWEHSRNLLSARWLAYQQAASDAWRTHQATLTAARAKFDQQASDAWEAYIEAIAGNWESYLRARDNAVVPGTVEPDDPPEMIP